MKDIGVTDVCMLIVRRAMLWVMVFTAPVGATDLLQLRDITIAYPYSSSSSSREILLEPRQSIFVRELKEFPTLN